jgi:hypothetical protein
MHGMQHGELVVIVNRTSLCEFKNGSSVMSSGISLNIFRIIFQKGKFRTYGDLH